MIQIQIPTPDEYFACFYHHPLVTPLQTREPGWEEQVYGQPRHPPTLGNSQVRLRPAVSRPNPFNLPLQRHDREFVWWSPPRLQSPQVSANQNFQSGVNFLVYKLRGIPL